MAKVNPLTAVVGLGGRMISPQKIPSTGGWGYGTSGSAGERIPSHPFYQHPMTSYKVKMERGGKYGRGAYYADDFYDAYRPEGLSDAQWDAMTTGEQMLGQAQGPSGELAFGEAEGFRGGRWYSPSDIDPTTGEPTDTGYEGRSILGTLKQKKSYWGGVYQGGGYGYPSWAKGWYEPARHVGIERPLESMPEEEFRDIADVNIGSTSEEFGLGIEPGEQMTAGQTASLTGLAGEVESAKEDYEAVLGELYGTGGTQEELEIARASEEQRLRSERQAILRGRYPEFEERQAALAQTGMAYSAPAQRAIEYGREQEALGLADITRGERELKRQYEGKQQEITESAEEAWRQYGGRGPEGRVKGYWESIGNIFGNVQVEAQDIYTAGENLLNQWEGFGEQFGPIGTIDPSSGVKEGILSSGQFFGEATSAYQPFETFAQTPQATQEAADRIIGLAEGKIRGLSDRPGEGTGGY